LGYINGINEHAAYVMPLIDKVTFLHEPHNLSFLLFLSVDLRMLCSDQKGGIKPDKLANIMMTPEITTKTPTQFTRQATPFY
jgi:hypothetical protein